MPIRPELRALYPPHWSEIRDRILHRARRRCERCGKLDRTPVETVWDGSGRWRPLDETVWRGRDGHAHPDQVVRGRRHETLVVLTVAHLDQDPRHNDEANLAALCQGCHLWHDRHQHATNARATKRRRRYRHQLPLRLETPNG